MSQTRSKGHRGARRGLRSLAAGMALVGALLAATADPAGAQDTPEELCAALEGQPGYAECLEGVSDALDNGTPGPTADPDAGIDADTPADADAKTGKELAEENLDEQRQLLWSIVGVVLFVVVIVVALSWRRSMRTVRDMFSPETLALMESMIPPEVRAEHPDAHVGDGLTEKERRLFRGQRNLVIVLLVVPAVVFVVLQVWQPSVDTSMQIGEAARIGPLVLAIPALWWTRRRVQKAARAGDDRWAVLGLHMESTPEVIILPRFSGGLRATAVGTSVLTGTRHGRRVRIELGEGHLVTALQRPDVPYADLQPAAGPGGATIRAVDGWLILDRKVSNRDLIGPDAISTVLHDLRDLEQVASDSQG